MNDLLARWRHIRATAMRHLRRHGNRFTQCWVRVNRLANIDGIGTHLDGQSHLADHVAPPNWRCPMQGPPHPSRQRFHQHARGSQQAPLLTKPAAATQPTKAYNPRHPERTLLYKTAHDYLVAFSCKGRGVCPSCNTCRMAEAAAHLCDHVFPHLEPHDAKDIAGRAAAPDYPDDQRTAWCASQVWRSSVAVTARRGLAVPKE